MVRSQDVKVDRHGRSRGRSVPLSFPLFLVFSLSSRLFRHHFTPPHDPDEKIRDTRSSVQFQEGEVSPSCLPRKFLREIAQVNVTVREVAIVVAVA